MCVCALLTCIRKEWISVRLFVYKWTHSGPKRRRTADLRVSMQPRQRSSRHKQLRNTTCLRTALKNPVKCSKWCELKKKERKKQSLPAIVAVYSFSSGFWESSKALLIITLTRTDTFLLGRFTFSTSFFKTKTFFDLNLNCKMHFFLFFLFFRKERKRLEVCFVSNETDSSIISQVLNARCYSLPCHLHGEEDMTTHQSRKSHSSLGAWNILESWLTAQ